MEDILGVLDEGILVVDSIGKISYCNLTFLDWIESTKEYVVHQSVEAYLDFEKGTHNALLKTSRDQVLKVHVDVLKKIWKDEVFKVYVIKEIESRKRLQLYEEVLDHMTFPIWIKDEQEKYYFINEAFAKEMNRINSDVRYKKKEEVLGKQEAEVLPKYMMKQIEENEVGREVYYKNSSYEVINLNSDKEQHYIRHVIPCKSEMISGYSIGVSHNTSLFNKIRKQVSKEERQHEKDVKVELKYELIETIYSNYKTIELLQADMRKMLGSELVILGIFAKDRTKCFVSYSRKDQNFQRQILDIDQEVVNSMRQFDSSNHWGTNRIQMEKIIWELILKHIHIKDIRYEICPIKLVDDMFGVVILGINGEQSRSINIGYEIQQLTYQIAEWIKNMAWNNIIEQYLGQKKELKEEHQAVLQVASDLIIMMNEDGRMLKLNGIRKLWKQKLGWHAEEFIGEYYYQFMHPDDRAFYQELKEKRPFTRQTKDRRILTKDGKYIWCEINTDYIPDRHIYISALRDINDQKQRQIEQKVHKQAKEIENIRNQFFANLSHEFRTPINIILSSTKLLEEYSTSEQVRGGEISWCTEKIANNALRLLRLSNNLVDLTMMGMNNNSINLKNQNIVSIVEEITLSVIPYTHKKEIDIIFDTQEEEIILACDKEKIERVLLNLLSNAIKFTPKKGRIEVSVWYKEGIVRIEVKDTGSGIPKETRAVIFEQFIQADNSLRRQCEGCGMGLSIAKKIIELHDGGIQIYSEEGKGSSFTVELPVRLIEENQVNKKVYMGVSNKEERVKMELSDIYYS